MTLKCGLQSRRVSKKEIKILGVLENETCYKTGCISTRIFIWDADL